MDPGDDLGDESAASSEIERDLRTLHEFTGYLIPIYPATAALPTWRIQKAVTVLLEHHARRCPR